MSRLRFVPAFLVALILSPGYAPETHAQAPAEVERTAREQFEQAARDVDAAAQAAKEAAIKADQAAKDTKEKAAAADPAADVPSPEPTPAPEPSKKETPSADIPGLTRLAKDYDVWIDAKRKIVVVDGRIALREGPLEMFACPKGTKEHESLVAVNAKPSFVHAGLLAVGALSGKPAKWDPTYTPATGTPVEIIVLWKDKDGKNRKVRAQEWILNAKTKKPMTHGWVFAGSGFWIDEETGEKHYHADGGDFICVSNFPTALLDIPVESSMENSGLMFQANTAALPEKGTKVRIVLIPKVEEKKEGKTDETEKSDENTKKE